MQMQERDCLKSLASLDVWCLNAINGICTSFVSARFWRRSAPTHHPHYRPTVRSAYAKRQAHIRQVSLWLRSRDGRILIFSRIPDSDTRHLISGRSRIRIFDVTTVSLYLQQNTGNRIQLLFSVIHNVTHVT